MLACSSDGHTLQSCASCQSTADDDRPCVTSVPVRSFRASVPRALLDGSCNLPSCDEGFRADPCAGLGGTKIASQSPAHTSRGASPSRLSRQACPLHVSADVLHCVSSTFLTSDLRPPPVCEGCVCGHSLERWIRSVASVIKRNMVVAVRSLAQAKDTHCRVVPCVNLKPTKVGLVSLWCPFTCLGPLRRSHSSMARATVRPVTQIAAQILSAKCCILHCCIRVCSTASHADIACGAISICHNDLSSFPPQLMRCNALGACIFGRCFARLCVHKSPTLHEPCLFTTRANVLASVCQAFLYRRTPL
mmetsp:Transcript_114700/g.364561  ORF Transcript_114700/g.364561 Transcript_114700/m.364561 type:complete len:305 (+) Transcript_114700:174-1088(+)